MVFSSIPSYLHHPSNCQQMGSSSSSSSSSFNPIHLHLHPHPPPPPPSQPHGGAGSVRPGGSMLDRARLANIPMPDSPLNCPRCDSTNTKFCYFNNYSLTQPRHFCKTCRRYWTRGGVLRKVPVGGGCRRNKRTSSKSSKSPAGGEHQAAGGSSLDPPLQGQIGEVFAGDVNYAGILRPAAGFNELELQLGGNNFIDPWRPPHQFPILDLSSQPGITYQFHGDELGFISDNARGGGRMQPKFSTSVLSQLEVVKMEEWPWMAALPEEVWNSCAAWSELSGGFSAPPPAAAGTSSTLINDH